MITEKVKVSLFREVYREQFKYEHFKDYNAIAYERSATGLAKRENNDCVVKAFMCALDCNYEMAHKFIADKMKRGDRKGTWLLAEGDEYSKLDYPRLSCPLNMPGFTNYEKSKPDEAEAPITRRFYIEQMPYKEMEKINVTNPEPPVSPNTTPSS